MSRSRILAEALLRDRAEVIARKPVRKSTVKANSEPGFDPFAITRWRVIAGGDPGYLVKTPMRRGPVGWFIPCRACAVEFAAPSKLASGSYEIIHGHLDDLDRLTPMVGLEKITTAPVPAKFSGMRTGDGRNRALWERCMRAGAGRSLDGMLEIARNANEHFKERLMEAEVVKIATSAWQHDVAGLN